MIVPKHVTIRGAIGECNRRIYGLDATGPINAGLGNDVIYGSAGNRSYIHAQGDGNDALDGSAGIDTASYTGNIADYGFTVSGGVIRIEDKNLANGNDGIDSLLNFEKLHFANKDVGIVDGLRYIASYGDLINAYHTNADAGLSHYYGYAEGSIATLLAPPAPEPQAVSDHAITLVGASLETGTQLH